MSEVFRDYRVSYEEGEQIKSFEKLMADGTQVMSCGSGFKVEPKATDLSRVKPRRVSEKTTTNIIKNA